jgi:hypothetical protein
LTARRRGRYRKARRWTDRSTAADNAQAEGEPAMDMKIGSGRNGGDDAPDEPGTAQRMRIERLEQALGRAERAAVALEQRQRRIEQEVRGALAMLDALIAGMDPEEGPQGADG